MEAPSNSVTKAVANGKKLPKLKLWQNEKGYLEHPFEKIWKKKQTYSGLNESST